MTKFALEFMQKYTPQLSLYHVFVENNFFPLLNKKAILHNLMSLKIIPKSFKYLS